MKFVMKASEIISTINSLVTLETRMAIRFKLNDRKWSDTATILRREKARLVSEIKNIDGAIDFLKKLEE
jgi:hypothetical protein